MKVHPALLVLAYLVGMTMAPAQTPELVDEFKLGPQLPSAALVLAGDGCAYGTTLEGGASNLGTVYRIRPTGEIDTLASFTGTSGALPGTVASSELVLASDGNLYGVTEAGGPDGAGTVFKVVPGGAVTSLASFTGYQGTLPGVQPIRSLAVGAVPAAGAEGAAAGVGAGGAAGFTDSSRFHIAEFLPLYWKILVEGTF